MAGGDDLFDELGRGVASAGGANVASAVRATEAPVGVDGEGQAEGLQAAGPVGGHQSLVDRVQGERSMWVSLARPLERAEVLFAAGDAVELLRLGVVGFEGVVGDGPIPKGAREAVPVVLAGVEVVLAGAQEGRAVQGRATAEDAAHV